MANSRKCKFCKKKNKPSDYIVRGVYSFCNLECAYQSAYQNMDKGAKIIKKEQKKKDQRRKKELMTRSDWFAKLKLVCNQYQLHVRDAGKACYTCGTTSQSIKYDAGHRHHAGRGGGDRRRFLPENIHKQCSMQCNQYGSGKPKEYDIALDKEYGEGFAEHLSCVSNYPTLKELFPTWKDIESEITRYRKLLRDNGLKPNA